MCESNHPIIPNNSTEKDPYLEAKRSLTSQETTRDLRNLLSPPVPAMHSYMSHIKTAHVSHSKIHFNIITPSIHGSFKCIFTSIFFLIRPTCKVHFIQKDNGRRVQTINPHIIQMSRASSSFWRLFNHEYNSYSHFTCVTGMQVQLLILILKPLRKSSIRFLAALKLSSTL